MSVEYFRKRKRGFTISLDERISSGRLFYCRRLWLDFDDDDSKYQQYCVGELVHWPQPVNHCRSFCSIPTTNAELTPEWKQFAFDCQGFFIIATQKRWISTALFIFRGIKWKFGCREIQLGAWKLKFSQNNCTHDKLWWYIYWNPPLLFRTCRGASIHPIPLLVSSNLPDSFYFAQLPASLSVCWLKFSRVIW